VLAFAPHITAFIVLAAAFLFSMKETLPLPALSERNLAAFRMGASIYVGTFLLGNNWDYRLAFLIFVIPQIAQWLFDSSLKNRWVLIGTIISLFASCWAMTILTYFIKAFGYDYGLQLNLFDELMNWILFAGLAYLLVASAPKWFRSYSWNPFSQEKLPDMSN
jgi:hypothetical protein